MDNANQAHDPSAEDNQLQFDAPAAAQLSTRASRQFLAMVVGLLVAFLAWASIAKLDRVTRGSGRVVSQERNNIVQHYEGGIIKNIFVAEGDRVEKGAVLFRIENSFAQADLAAANLELTTARLKRARLIAEANGAAEIDFADLADTAAPGLIAQQVDFFKGRQAELTETLNIIDDQVEQKALALSEKRSRLKNKEREKALMAERLDSLRALSEAGAVPRNELLQNETLYQQVISQVSDLKFQIPQTESALEEVKGRRREAILSFQAEARRHLTDAEFAISKLEETIQAQRDRKRRFDVAAPIDGVINKLFVSTIDGVVSPGQKIAEIVSDNAPIEIEAKLSPADRARVWPGLPAIVKVSAYDFATHGGLEGAIVEISPDALKDEQGDIYFRVRIEANMQDLGPEKPVVPGMLAEVDIITGKQTILEYLLKPIRDVQVNALKE